MHKLVLLLLVFSTMDLYSQPDFSDLNRVDSLYADYIRTVEFRRTTDELSMPIMELGSGRLVFEFDDSYGEYIDYYYTIKHCDRDWNFTENVEVSEYLEGPDNIQIENFASSVNTLMNYNHYSFSFPNADISLRWSGNYLLIVYDDEDNIMITRRFYVVDTKVAILPSNMKPNGSGTFDTHQAFKIKLDIESLNPINPTQELYLTGFQNRLNERTSPLEKPIFISGKYAEFNIGQQISFPGYKEYRFFDTRNILQAGENVQHIDLSDNHAMVLLELEKKRDIKPYYFRKESNGAFVLRNADRQFGEKDVTSEYPHVLFTLQSRSKEYGDVYVLGEFNDFKKHQAYKMEYLEVERAYSLEAPLKQGFYNYMYAMETEDGFMDMVKIEGSSYETENFYHFLCYYRPQSIDYDQLVGYTEFHVNAQ